MNEAKYNETRHACITLGKLFNPLVSIFNLHNTDNNSIV